jgi:hypothetical protein
MKTFWPTFWAILAAATVISLVAELKSCADDNAKINARTAEINALNAKLDQSVDALMEAIRRKETKERDQKEKIEAAVEAADAKRFNIEDGKPHGLFQQVHPTSEQIEKEEAEKNGAK